MKITLGDRSLFPDLQASAYLNHAAISPPSLPVRRAVTAVMEDYAAHGVGALGRALAQRHRLRERLARLIGAGTDDLGFVPNTSAGVTHIAACLSWRPGEQILLFDGEFPTNVTPWQQAAHAYGLRPTFLPLTGFGDGSGHGLTRVEDALKAGQGAVRLLAVSAVQFQTGLGMPVHALAALCHRYGAAIFVDAIQCVGSMPFSVGSVDYVACGGHKWLMGMEGSGFLYIRPDRLAELEPRTASWLSHDAGALDFLLEGPGFLRYDRPIRARADFVEGGVLSSMNLAALDAAVALLEDLSPEAIHSHIQDYLDHLETALLARGFSSARSPEPTARSGLLCVTPPPGIHLKTLHAALGVRGISTSMPDGRLRFSPHWPNHPREIPHIIAAIEDAFAGNPPVSAPVLAP